jgi:hypothetical protein
MVVKLRTVRFGAARSGRGAVKALAVAKMAAETVNRYCIVAFVV